MGTILVPLFAHYRPAHHADRRHHIDRFAGGLRHQPRRMESGSDDRADARIPLHEDQWQLGKREVRNALQSSGAMAFRIDDMEAILRFEDGLDVDRPNRSAH